MWLTVHDEERLDQLVKQMAKLEDVREIRNAGVGDLFGRIETALSETPKNQSSAPQPWSSLCL